MAEIKDNQYEKVAGLIMVHLESGCTNENIFSKLKEIINSDHSDDCAIGSVPACTCGLVEARAYVRIIEDLKRRKEVNAEMSLKLVEKIGEGNSAEPSCL